MEAFKIAHFERDKPGHRFPEFYSLNPSEAERLRSKLLERFSLDATVNPIRLLEVIASNGLVLSGVNAEQEGFRLDMVFNQQGIKPQQRVYVNWYRFDLVDEFDANDLSKHFDYVWYPSSDDIDVFDSTLSWIVSIRHDGVVSVTKIPDPNTQLQGKANRLKS